MRLFQKNRFTIFIFNFCVMTIAEKKNKIKKCLETFSNEQLEETLSFVEQIRVNDEKRKDYIQELMKKERNLFERLAK